MKRSGGAIGGNEARRARLEPEIAPERNEEAKDAEGRESSIKEEEEKDDESTDVETDEQGQPKDDREEAKGRLKEDDESTLEEDSDAPDPSHSVDDQDDMEESATAGQAFASMPSRKKAGDESPSKLSYPKPKNFAERMMNALEKGIASESIWWVGDGKAVALHPKNLKMSSSLTEYFKAKDYSGFIRNCNRWGFRRVAAYRVSPGIVTYENSLFQRDHAHLVKHMRMDSDVQDVFARHQKTSDGDARADESEADKTARLIAEVKAMKRENRTRRPRHQAAADAESLERASAVFQSTANLDSLPVDDSSLSKEFLFRKILQLSEQFLDHPGSLYSEDASMTTTMQLVRALGQQHEQSLQESGHLNAVLQLENSVQQAQAEQRRATIPAAAAANPSAPAPVPPAEPPAAPHPPAAASRPEANPLGNHDLTMQLLARTQPNSNSTANALEALLLQSQGTHLGQLLQQAHAAPQPPPPPPQQQERLGVDRLLAEQLQQSLLGSSSGDANSMLAAALAQSLAPRVEQQQQPQQAVVGTSNQEMKSNAADGGAESSPQFTTAQELLMRVMNQRRNPGGN
ncbi:HSF-type DNA-binding [Seminavis robusta]|uniref:HSF-type DNA-binding n=1 Tax=Seminavis robusta TaxID=568900 RepID=A0A9N8EP15_9STRA|nr:HSF-type DNA-binding [Seminavis robusta]|eukprot:Sro1506_g278250.1 HSF-type DNA-binding (574) ;mRNA; f:1568-3600